MDLKRESEMFDQMADYYDRFRPGYPQEIVDAIIHRAELTKGSRVLEIGPGSGKATEQFANFGFEMLCLDPGEELVKKGNERFRGKNITFAASRFEEYPLPTAYFDTIISAQAFHWTPKPLAYKLCAETLKTGGILAPFWNIEVIHDTELDSELFTILDTYDAFTATMKNAAYEKRVQTMCDDIASSGFFTAPEVIQAHWEKTYTAEEYFGFAMTGNVFVRNPEAVKRACFCALEKLAAKYGGIRRRYICELYLARKI